MAIVNLSKRSTGVGYEYSEVIADGVDGDIVLIYPVRNISDRVTCTIVSAGNTGKVQFTTTPIADLASANWQDWPNGNVVITTSDALLGPVTAIRGVSVSGEVTLEVVV